ncbi:putative voltage-gated chloride channel (clc-a) [Exidia glandulosa HHB12029]|uniref:Chloride channel protein n=1 Tax=Exidia glandulosa HHB12029 TaxID=1314781 RepID=A0A165IHQ0_EXIGL|nr:putative voltage-gated chloride channel (clc-a) [Exidia glandulosa HHB12029]
MQPTALPQNEPDDEEEYDKLIRYEDFSTIDWIKDSLIERNRRAREARTNRSMLKAQNGRLTSRSVAILLKKFLIGTQSWLVVVIVGLCIGVNAALISILTEWLADLKTGFCSEGWWLNLESCCTQVVDANGTCQAWKPWSNLYGLRWIIYVLFSITFAYVAAHLVKVFAKYAAGSGISEIKCIIAGFIMKGYLGATTLAIKSLTLPLTIASGLSVGKEGPSVHVAACIGYIVARMFSRVSRSQSKMREMLTASSAAGVAVAFGSPIGGVLFSIEEMTANFTMGTMWRSFVCALVATMALSAVNPFRTGKLVLFAVTYDRSWNWFEIPFFVIIGVFGGLYGAFVIKFNLQVQAFRRKHLANHAVVEVVVLAALTALFGWFNMFLRIDMTESLAVLFRECDGGGGDYENLCQTWAQWRMVNLLLLATIFRVGFVVVSYGCRVPAGIFIPSMAVGATFGRMVGIIVKAMYRANPTAAYFSQCPQDSPCITPGTYALLGAAAALGGVMRITVSVVVIMIELTGALTYVLPLMVVLLATKSVGDYFGSGGIADQMIKFNGFPYLHDHEDEDEAHENVPVSLVMRKDLFTLPARGMCASEVEKFLDDATVQGFPIVSTDSRRLLVGYIERQELRYVLDRARRTGGLLPHTECSFAQPTAEEARERRGSTVNGFAPNVQLTSGTAMGIEEGEAVELIETAAVRDSAMLRLWPWVNQTPIIVQPQMSLEIVEKLFRTMGPRVILVVSQGSLEGLVTVKDVLRFNATSASDTSTLESDMSIWDSGALTAALEDTWLWMQEGWRDGLSRTQALFGRR